MIRGVIDDHCVLPVEMLPAEDLAELEGLLRRAYSGPRRGWQYIAWRAEVRLALGTPDPLRALKAKAPAKRQAAAGVLPGVVGWLEDQAVAVDPVAEQVAGEDFELNGGS